jgi:hypothetical protein
MTQYLLSMYQPDEGTPPPEFLEKVMAELAVLNQQIREAGGWVFSGGLQPAGSSAVLRSQNGEVVQTSGPYLQGDEHLGGFWIIEAPNLDIALEWGRWATRATGLPTEVRAFQGGNGS